ncbi:flagellar hook-length control protein FliK [Candidatus Latescibacterota bacterium]
MFIDFQSNGAEVLAKLLSPEVKTNNAELEESTNFESLLASLMYGIKHGDSGKETKPESSQRIVPTGVTMPVILNADTAKIKPEEISAMTVVQLFDGQDSDGIMKIDAELIIESNGISNSIPAAIILMKQNGESESGKTAMFLLLDTGELSTLEKDTLLALFGGNTLVNNELHQLSDKSETITIPEQKLPETDEIPQNTTGLESNDIKEDAGVFGVFISGETPVVTFSQKNNTTQEITNMPVGEPDSAENAELPGNSRTQITNETASPKTASFQMQDLSGEMTAVVNNISQNKSKVQDTNLIIRKLTFETASSESGAPQLIIETTSNEPKLIVIPKNTDSVEKLLAGLIKEGISSGETIEIAIVVDKESPFKQGPNNDFSLISETGESHHINGIQNPVAGEKFETVNSLHVNSDEMKLKPSVTGKQILNLSDTDKSTITNPPEKNITVNSNNSEPLSIDKVFVSDAPEMTADDKTGQTVTNVSESKNSGATVKPVSHQTEKIPEINVVRKYEVPQFNGKAAETVKQPDNRNVSAEDVKTMQGGNKTVSADYESNVKSTINEKQSINSTPADTQSEARARIVYSDADAGKNEGMKNTTVEENSLFHRTQREISEHVRNSNGETVKQLNNTVNNEVDSSRAVSAQKTAVHDTLASEKPQTNIIIENSEVKPESNHTVLSENLSEETTTVSPKEDVSIKTPLQKSNPISDKNISAEDFDAPNHSFISKPVQTTQPVTHSAGEKQNMHTSSKEAIIYGTDNTSEHSPGKKSSGSLTVDRKNGHYETESMRDGTMTLDAVEMNGQKELMENHEFLHNRETATEQFADFDNLSGDTVKSADNSGDKNVFGLTTESQKGDITPQVNTVNNTVQANVSGDVDEKKILESIVRQAQFMNQKEKSSADIKLDPPHLGKLRIELVTENSKITGRITVESHEVREIIQHSISELRDNLAQNGLKVDSFDVNIGHNNSSGLWERMQKFRLAPNHMQKVSTSSDSSEDSASDPLLRGSKTRTISAYSESFDVVI